MKRIFCIALSMGVLVSTIGCSSSQAGSQPATDDAAVRTGVAKLLPPEAKIDSIKPSAIEGISEVMVDGRVAYVTNDGKHLIQGPMLLIDTRENLTERSEASARRVLLDELGPERRIIFPATNKVPTQVHRVTIFTDVECGYCRKLHAEIAAYNEAGITIEYVLYPRSGMNSPAAVTSQSVWCAADRAKALTEAKLGHAVPEKTCENYIAEDYQLGQRIGVAGTPAIYAENGQHIGGYLPVEQMKAALDQASRHVN